MEVVSMAKPKAKERDPRLVLRDSVKRANDAAKFVKTSLKLDRELWKEAHLRAMDAGTDLQTIVNKALDTYLWGAKR
jgi:hypothetical protein